MIKKYIANATIRKEITALINEPYANLLGFIVKNSPEKSGDLKIAPIIGVIISLTKELTTAPKAPPITTPTARSTTLPLIINFLNPWNIMFEVIF